MDALDGGMQTLDGKQYYVFVATITKPLPTPSDYEGPTEPTPLAGPVTREWLAVEIAKAFKRDEADPFYADNEERMDALNDVADTLKGTYIFVLTEEGNFFGKIQIYVNADNQSVNAMYLYVAGDTRRARGPQQLPVFHPRQSCGTSSPCTPQRSSVNTRAF